MSKFTEEIGENVWLFTSELLQIQSNVQIVLIATFERKEANF